MKIIPSLVCAITVVCQARGQAVIQSGDTVFLRSHAGEGKQLHVDGVSVKGLWTEHGNWQAFTILKDGGGLLHSDDAIFLKAHTGNQIDVQGVAVQARWDDLGAWQTLAIQSLGGGPIHTTDIVCMKAHTGKYLEWNGGDMQAQFEECTPQQQFVIEKEDPGALFSGSTVYLKAHTGKHIEVDGSAVQARWHDKGLWQRMLIESWGGRALWSGDRIFLKGHTGLLFDIEGTAVQARWNKRGLWQSLVIEKDGGGAIYPGDTIFLLSSNTGRRLDVEGDVVRCRWHDRGTWQGLVIELDKDLATTFTTTAGATTQTTTVLTTTVLPTTTQTTIPVGSTSSAQTTTILTTTVLPTTTQTTIPVGTTSTPMSNDAIIPAVIEALQQANSAGVFLYDTGKQWLESDIYTWPDMIEAVRLMATNGVGNTKLWLGDAGETNVIYGLVNIAAFLAQSMQESIQYNACDENNWSNGPVVQEHGGTIYSAASACGQAAQSYQDYQCSAEEDAAAGGKMACDVDPNMQMRAYTQAKWYGAPAKLFCAPRSKVPKAPRWDFTAPWCAPPGGWGRVEPFADDVALDTYWDYVNNAGSCKDYNGVQTGGWKFTGPGCVDGACPGSDAPLFGQPVGRKDVEGCCWWGRGVIQTTGTCNFGKLNFYLGKRAADEGRPSLYPGIDFCRDPNKICAPDGPPELKWVAGFFYWLNAVQPYEKDAWNYKAELKKWVDGGMNLADTGFINGASGIVNRGCHNPPNCQTGELHGGPARIANFKKVLQALRLTLV